MIVQYMNTMSYYREIYFLHSHVQLNVYVFVANFILNNRKIPAAFHQSLQYWQTEFFTVERLDNFVYSFPSSFIHDIFRCNL